MKIQKFEYESLIRDSERLSIIDTVVTDYHYLDMQLLRILCGRQQKDIPNIQPTEPAIMIEAVEDPADKQRHKLMTDFHSEEEPGPPKDSTPRREFHQMCGFQCQPEESRQGKSNGTA